MRFTCADALDDGTLIDSRQGDQLAAAASGLEWKEGYGLPTPCHRVVRLFCGPDLDHDGDPEAIVQIDWWQIIDGNTCESVNSSDDYWPVSYTFLASRHASDWRAIAPLGVGIFGDQQELRRSAHFVRFRGSKLAVRVDWSNVASDTGCEIGGYEVFSLNAGILKRIEVGDRSLPCSSCCGRP